MRKDKTMARLMTEFRGYQRSLLLEKKLDSKGNIVVPMPGGGDITLKCDGPLISPNTFRILATQYLMPEIRKELKRSGVPKAKAMGDYLYKAIVEKGEDKSGPDQLAKDFITGRTSVPKPKDPSEMKGIGGLLNPNNWEDVTGVTVEKLHAAINVAVTDFFNSGVIEQIIDSMIKKIKSAAAGTFEISDETIESMRSNLATMPNLLAANFLKNTKLVHSIFSALVDGDISKMNKGLRSLETRVLKNWFESNEGKNFLDRLTMDILKGTVFTFKVGNVKRDALKAVAAINKSGGDFSSIPKELLVSFFVWSQLRDFRKGAGDDEPVFEGDPSGGEGVYSGIKELSDKVVAKIGKNGICSIAQVYKSFSDMGSKINFWSLMKTFAPVITSLRKENPWLDRVLQAIDDVPAMAEELKKVIGDRAKAKDLLASLGVSGKGAASIIDKISPSPGGDPTTMIA